MFIAWNRNNKLPKYAPALRACAGRPNPGDRILMEQLIERSVDCPYCGESIEVLLDDQDAEQEYIEDCQVCCRPITFRVVQNMSDGLSVSVWSENDLY